MTLNVSSVGWRTEPKAFAYDWKQLALYALGIGAQVDELDYLYEGRGPASYPTFAVVPAIEHLFHCLKTAGAPLASVVHGGQTVRSLGPLPPTGELTTYGEITHFYDMKKFAQLVVRTESSTGDGTPVFETVWSIVVRGAGGFGGAPPPRSELGKVPSDRPSDFRVEQATHPEQALLYRLSGDTNPLHADPAVAHAVGFDRGPILHGLATFGFAARAVIRAECNGDAARLASIDGQFRRPVWPSETLVTEGWRVDDRIVLQTKVAERDEVVLSNAWATLRD